MQITYVFVYVSFSISVMRETSDLIEKYGDGSSLSEAHCGGWEGLGNDEGNRRCDRLHIHN
ncbi:MAG: hypothetical protein U9O50_05535 [Acidobacteriota bacterium]|nr:hypothetical protein [Acidobacteriota bacterium]